MVRSESLEIEIEIELEFGFLLRRADELARKINVFRNTLREAISHAR